MILEHRVQGRQQLFNDSILVKALGHQNRALKNKTGKCSHKRFKQAQNSNGRAVNVLRFVFSPSNFLLAAVHNSVSQRILWPGPDTQRCLCKHFELNYLLKVNHVFPAQVRCTSSHLMHSTPMNTHNTTVTYRTSHSHPQVILTDSLSSSSSG
jgi:hypothetical protein